MLQSYELGTLLKTWSIDGGLILLEKWTSGYLVTSAGLDMRRLRELRDKINEALEEAEKG